MHGGIGLCVIHVTGVLRLSYNRTRMIDACDHVCYAPKTRDHLFGQDIGIKALQPFNTACIVLCDRVIYALAVPGILSAWYTGQNGEAP